MVAVVVFVGSGGVVGVVGVIGLAILKGNLPVNRPRKVERS